MFVWDLQSKQPSDSLGLSTPGMYKPQIWASTVMYYTYYTGTLYTHKSMSVSPSAYV